MVWDASAESLILKGNDLDLNNGTALHRITNDNTNLLIRADYGNTNANSTIQFSLDGTERMRIDSSGNVGIGTASPTQKLDLVGSGDTYAKIGNGTYNSYFGTATGETYIGNDAAKNITFYNGSTERARIDSSGNLLVGTTEHIGSTAGGVSAGNSVSLGGNEPWSWFTGNSDNVSAVVYIQSIGTSTHELMSFQTSTGNVGSVTSNGTSTNYNTTSDERLKENIVDTTHTVDINDIQVREFDWKVDGSHQRYGFIAQELETVYPEAVHSPEDTDKMKSVDYSKLVPLLVKEIQTLKARIETLENN